MKEAAGIVQRVLDNVKTVIVGKDDQIRRALCCWLAGGHVLIEDVPGTGKTIMARAIAKSIDVPFSRVQFTPDLLPSDIIGASIYRQDAKHFEFIPGPLFTTVLLGDEINRATPRTQSALLEAMSEGQASIEGKSLALSPLFFAIATQNPVDQLGTFPLPEAQLDRFMMKISMGYPGAAEEALALKRQNRAHPIHSLIAVETSERWQWAVDQVAEVMVSDEIYDYAVALAAQTRRRSDVRVGASPRASAALVRAAQASALAEGAAYVSPSHIFQLARPVFAHRIILTAEAKIAGKSAIDVVDEAVAATPAPTRKR